MSGAAGRLGLVLGSFAYVGAFGTILPAEFPEVRIVAQLLFGLPLAAWGVVRLGRRRTALDLPIALALVLFLLVALFSRDVQGSFEMLAGALAWALLFWLMTDLRSPSARGSVAMGVVGALTAWLAVFAVRWGTEKVTWVANGGGMPNLVESSQTLFWLTTNVAPALTLLGLGFLGYLPRSPASRVLVMLFVAASIVTVPMSGGRAGWLGLLVVGIALPLLRGFERVSLRLDRRVAIAIGVAAVASILAVVTVGGRALDASGLSARLPLWTEALSILAADPLTGGGPGTYSWLRLEHVEPYHSPVPAVLAHNVVLQTLADGGPLLFMALAIVVGAAARTAWRRRGHMPERDRRVTAVLIGFAAVSLLDDHSSLPAVAAMVVTLAAWLVVPSEARLQAAGEQPNRTHRWTGGRRRAALIAVVAVVAVVSIPAAWRVDVARAEAHAGRLLMLRGDFDAAIGSFGRAIDAYPARPNYHMSAGMALALDGQLDAARDRYRRATELAPADARGWGALAALATTDEDRLAFAYRAAAAPTSDPRYAYVLGEALAARGDAEAPVAFARAITRGPGTALALRDRGSGSADAGAAVDYAIENAPALGAEARIDHRRVRWDLALAAFAPDDDLPPAWRAVGALQRADLSAAEAALAEAIQTDRFATRTWEAAMAVARYRCDEEADRAAATLAGLSPGGSARPRGELVYRTSDLAYRETGLASYQPVLPPYDAALLTWPDAFVGEPSDCTQ